MRAPFLNRVFEEYAAIAPSGKAVDAVVSEQIRARTIVRDRSDVDPDLVRYYAWTPKGIEAYEATRSHLYTLFGGAKGGSKTVTGCRLIASDVAEYQGGLYVVMRQNYTSLHITTKASFERFFPKDLIVRKTASRWYLVNGNELLWWAADRTRDPNYEKTRGLEATGIFPDEASEFDDDFYQLLPSLLRRDAFHIETGEKHPGWIYLTSNPVPGTNYLKKRFIDERTRMRDDRHIFIPSLPDDNPLLPEGYTDRAFSTMDEAMLKMLRFGDWNVEASEFAIVPIHHLHMVMVDQVIDRTPIAAGIDIGLGRPDKSKVVCSNAAGEMWVEASFEEYDTMRQVELLRPIVAEVKSNRGRVRIDEGSVGKGVYDALRREFGPMVIGVMFGEAAEEERQPTGMMERVHDLVRDQMYFWLREDVSTSSELVSLGEQPILVIERSDELVEELENTFYVPGEKYPKLEPKSEIKRRIGRSPDTADADVLCNAARRKHSVVLRFPGTRKSGRTSRSSITDGFQ